VLVRTQLKKKIIMKKKSINYTNHLLSLVIILIFTCCNKVEDSSITYTITIDAYTLDNSGNYIATGNTLTFDSHEQCQTWSRTAGADSHSSSSHLHYNAADEVSFDNESTSFNWTEYGPELDQASIDATCSAGAGGVNKTVNDVSYYQDKPNLYLKINSVVAN